jgi:acetyl esterase/lipase
MSPTPPLPERQTAVYARVEGQGLELDLIGAEPGARKPALMWIHGGGLIFGSRKASPRPYLVQALLARGFVVASIDHRLAPATKLEAIFEDVRAAWRWLHDSGPALAGVDPARTAIAGASAGGYLSLLAGTSRHRFEPRPRALASLFGFGDITAPWEAEPSAHYRGDGASDLVTADAAWASVTGEAGGDRSTFYLYCRQQGLWLQHVTGHTLPGDAAWFGPWCPLGNIDAAFPPTLLVHGQLDTDVPHAESAALAERLAACGVRHRFVSVPDAGHGFAGAPVEVVQTTEDAVADFLAAELR